MVRRTIYLLRVKFEFNGGYDSYDAHIVIAKNENEAREMCPCGDEEDVWNLYREKSICEKIGTSTLESQYVLGSFNAG